MTLDIYSVGDSEFLYNVFMALKMLQGGKTFIGLGLIGALLGLLTICVKSIMTGGREFNIHQTLFSVILFMIMFVPKADVVIYQEYSIPGIPAGSARPVTGVPFGPAVIASLMSRLGFAATSVMETAFGTAEGTRVTQGGFGHTLERLAFLRYLTSEALVSNGKTQPMTLSFTHYIQSCVVDGIDKGLIDTKDLYRNADPLQALTVDSDWLTVLTYVNGSGAPLPAGREETVTCKDAVARLKSGKRDQTFTAGLNEVLRAPLGMSADDMPLDQIARSFADVGTDMTGHLQDFVMAGMYHRLAGAASAAAVVNMHQNAGAIMIEQASQQRAVQWAAEETMFERVMRPIQSFFEGLVPALAPIMAFVIGFGEGGLGLLVKYLVLTLWVNMFLPVLAISNLWSLLVAQRFLRLFTDPPPSSIGGVMDLMAQASDWLATASLMVSSTPVLTLSLIYGGAVTASALAGRMQGGDHVNEKVMSPDAISPGPGLNVSAGHTASPTTGSLRTGSEAMLDKYSFKEEFASSTRSAEAASRAATAQWVDSIGSSRGENQTLSTAVSQAVDQARQHMAGWDTTKLTSTLKDHGFSDKYGIAQKLGHDRMMNIAMEGALGASASALGAMVRTGLSQVSNDKIDVSDSAIKDFSSSLSHSVKQSEDFKVSTGESLMTASRSGKTDSFTRAQSASSSSELRKSASEASERRAQYEEASSRSRSVAASGDMNLAQAVQRAIDWGVDGAIVADAQKLSIDEPGHNAFSETVGLAKRMGFDGDRNAEVASAFMTLQGAGVGQVDPSRTDGGSLANRQAGYLKALEAVSPGAAGRISGAGSGPSLGMGLGGSAPRSGSVENSVSAGAHGPSGNPAAGGARLGNSVNSALSAAPAAMSSFLTENEGRLAAAQAGFDRSEQAAALGALSGRIDSVSPKDLAGNAHTAQRYENALDIVPGIGAERTTAELHQQAHALGEQVKDLHDPRAQELYGYLAVGADPVSLLHPEQGAANLHLRQEKTEQLTAELSKDPYWGRAGSGGASRLDILKHAAHERNPNDVYFTAVLQERRWTSDASKN